MSRKSPVIQKGMQVALQAAEASWNNCTGVFALQKDFHFSNCKSNQIKSNLHFYGTYSIPASQGTSHGRQSSSSVYGHSRSEERALSQGVKAGRVAAPEGGTG